MNFFYRFLGYIFNFINDLLLFYFLTKTTFKHFYIHTKFVFKIFIKYLKNKSEYSDQFINYNHLKNCKKSNKLFIIGSGASINEINDETWEKISKHDTLGFNGSFHLKKVNITYHILRAGQEDPSIEEEDKIEHELEYAKYLIEKINSNVFYSKTIFLFSRGISQHFTNLLIGFKLWKSNSIFQYNTNKIFSYPRGNLSLGLIHRKGTLIDAISFGFHMGYQEIILLGIDLYNNHYFWADKNKTISYDKTLKKEVSTHITLRGVKASDTHNTFKNGIVNYIGNLKDYFESKNVKLFVFNPKSLLKKHLSVYKI